MGESYAGHKFRAVNVHWHARYVRLIIGYQEFAFCDEIAVYGPTRPTKYVLRSAITTQSVTHGSPGGWTNTEE